MRAFKKQTQRIPLVLLVLFLLLLAGIFASVMVGSIAISASDIFGVLFRRIHSGTSYVLITGIRIPRTLACIGAGLGLATAGVILQNVMNNSLASPNTIGVNSGAGFAVMVSMLFWPTAVAARGLFAFFGALVTSLLIFAL